MSTAPTWGPITSDTADLLDLLAETNPAIPSEAEEWTYFVGALETLAADTVPGPTGTGLAFQGLIDPNRLRTRLRGHVSPPRIGAFTRRALGAGLVAYSGTHVESDDVTSGNRGKPCRVLRWLGTQGGESNAR